MAKKYLSENDFLFVYTIDSHYLCRIIKTLTLWRKQADVITLYIIYTSEYYLYL